MNEEITQEYAKETIERMRKCMQLIKDDEKYIQALGTFTILLKIMKEGILE